MDQGTTTVRASVVDPALRVLASAAREVPRSFPAPGWVDLDASRVVDATEQACLEALDRLGLRPGELAGLGLANQGETVLLWDRRTGKPLAPAVGWQCRRTETACAALRAQPGMAGTVRRETGLFLDPYFSATKLAWLLNSVPGAAGLAAKGELLAGGLDAFTLYRWSGGKLHVTDPSTACRTSLAALSTGRWSDTLCSLFAVPRTILPEVVASDADVGTVQLGNSRVPVRAMLCDQPAALLGTGCQVPGGAKCTYGTGAFVQVSTGGSYLVEDDGLLRSIAWEIGGKLGYLLEGGVLAAGDVLAWLHHELGLTGSIDAIEASLESGAEPVVGFLPALVGLGAPHWNGPVRGMVAGVHRGTSRTELTRAALEGVCHLVADVLDAAAGAMKSDLAPVWADGGLAVSGRFLQLQADLAGRTLRQAPSTEATTRGIAAVALSRCGALESIEEAIRVEEVRRFEPRLDEPDRQRRRQRHRLLVDLAKQWAAE